MDEQKLTPREQTVLDLLLEGCSDKTIASRLNLSSRTVEIHVAAVRRKYGVSSVRYLLAKFIR